jgi:hypothetical protein
VVAWDKTHAYKYKTRQVVAAGAIVHRALLNVFAWSKPTPTNIKLGWWFLYARFYIALCSGTLNLAT